MNRHRAYLKYVLRHKWFVLQAGIEIGPELDGNRLVDGLRWLAWIVRLIMHDWDKFLPDEWFAYAETFYEADGSRAKYQETDAFAHAWNLHQKRNRHHWQFWLITWDRGETTALPMPEDDSREMIADWRGAGRAITGKDNTQQWFLDNQPKMKLHPATEKRVVELLFIQNATRLEWEPDES